MPRQLQTEKGERLTATVGELIAALQRYPPDTLVIYTWEGQSISVDLDEINLQVAPEPVVVLGADY